MKLDFIQNLTWTKVLTYITTAITISVGATWTIATRMADSKADFVNMRYHELTSLEEQIKTLSEENAQLRKQFDNSGDTIEAEAKSTSIPEAQSISTEVKSGTTHIDTITGVIVSVKSVFNSYADVTILFPNGESKSGSIYVGTNYNFNFKNKTYQVIFSELEASEYIKYIIREVSQSN